jgi:hypothetical protein
VQKTVHLQCKIVGRTCEKLAMAQLEFTLRGKLRKGGRMNTSERVVHFLRKRAGHYFCDDCIVQELRLSKPVTRMTDQIGRGSNMRGSGNRREVAICSRCGQQKPSTMILPEKVN